MKTYLVQPTTKPEQTSEFPQLWRNKLTETIYLATPGLIIVIHSERPDALPVGYSWENNNTWNSDQYERITTPVTINFVP